MYKLRLYDRKGNLDHEEIFDTLQGAINRRTEWGIKIGLAPEPSSDFARYPTIWKKNSEGEYDRILGY